MFDALRLSVEVLAEILPEVLVDVEAMDADRKNLYVIGAQSLVECICALLLRQGLASEYYLQYYPHLWVQILLSLKGSLENLK